MKKSSHVVSLTLGFLFAGALSVYATSIGTNVSVTGILGIGTSTPWALLSVNPNGVSGPEFAIGSSTATHLVVTNGGNVGVGTTSPGALLNVFGGNIRAEGDGNFIDHLGAGQLGRVAIQSSSSGLSRLVLQSSSGGIAGTTRWDVFSGGTASDYAGTNMLGKFGIVDSTQNLIRLTINTSGNLGVGTTTPNWLMQIAGTRPSLALTDSNASTNLKHWLLTSAGGNLYIGTTTDAYATSTPPVLTLANNGNVGIGTSTPASLFSVGGSGYVTGSLGIGTSNASFDLYLSKAGNAKFTVEGSPPDIRIRDARTGGANLLIRNDSSFNGEIARFYNETSGMDLVAITSTGPVGMGTTTPYAQLSVASGATATTTLALRPIAAQTANILDIYNTSGTLTSVYTAAGNFGIGTTTPSKTLSVAGDVYESSAATTTHIVDSTAANTGGCLQLKGPNGNWYRAYATTTGPLILEAGMCK